MGHDTHFLGRLDRVSDSHVELALELYRDQELLREVLNRASLPEGIERLAISLDDAVEGPFVIVTREGRFVTCLGRGMRVRKEQAPYVLPRARLDAAISKVERMRERVAEVVRLAQRDDGVASRAPRRMVTDGLRFCREDAQTVLEAVPLVAGPLSLMLTDSMRFVREHRKRVAYLRFDRLKPREVDLVRAFGRNLWTLAHLLVLTDQPELREIQDEIGQISEVDIAFLAVLTAVDFATYAHTTRALWLIGRRARSLIGSLKGLADDPRPQVRLLRELGLGAVACSSSKLRAEALKALTPPRSPDEVPTGPSAYLALVSSLGAEMVRHAQTAPAELERSAMLQGRAVATRLREKNPDPTDEAIDETPEDIGRAIYCSLPHTWLKTDEMSYGAMHMAGMQPWLARAAPTDLFLPRDVAQALPFDGLRDVAITMATYAPATFLDRPKPVVREAKVGRNAPCECGSGKKAKRCCVAA